ncbi:MAG: UDP-2,4-diacetamido-2,4,6-trideoxy-beta-L-altropyranose hydrolase [candidate division Zixibacteria bacterium]|nr:UDP-2,4-diacetamido-2,4,6-trideoxy-beta-L-altropyranose hydrolase [candidate division Zixibacteria bacterium]
MRIAIRTDSSTALGGGHLMRCLTLADRLRRAGAEVVFVCRDLPGNMSRLAIEQGYNTTLLPNDRHPGDTAAFDWELDAKQTLSIISGRGPFDWLIVDHYGLDRQWERLMRPHAARIMVIDDLADRPHGCDLLLDQNLTDQPVSRYDRLIPPHCHKLLGLSHVLLRPEFYDLRPKVSPRTGHIHRLFVSFGGGDITGETEKALAAIRLAGCGDIAVDVVIGGANRRRGEIEAQAQELPNARVHYQVPTVAQLMASADLALGGGGVTTWERCFLSLPSIVIIQAENQREMIESAARRQALWNMGWHHETTAGQLAAQLEYLLERPEIVRRTGENAGVLMADAARNDGRSVVNTIMEQAHVAS